MTADEAVLAYSGLPTERQLRVLVRYAMELTIVARCTYVPETEEIADPLRLRELNEAQHRVVGHIDKLLHHDAERFSDDSIVRIIIAENDPQLLSAFCRAITNKR